MPFIIGQFSQRRLPWGSSQAQFIQLAMLLVRFKSEVSNGVCITARPLRQRNMQCTFRLRIDEMSNKGGIRVAQLDRYAWPRFSACLR